jgi:hypothetical protein
MRAILLAQSLVAERDGRLVGIARHAKTERKKQEREGRS